MVPKNTIISAPILVGNLTLEGVLVSNLHQGLKVDIRLMDSLNKFKFLKTKFEVDERFLNNNLISDPFTRILNSDEVGAGALARSSVSV